MKKRIRKIIAAATTAAMSVALLAGSAPAAKADVDLGTAGTFTGDAQYISTTLKNAYYGQGANFEVTFQYDEVATTRVEDNTTVDVDFNDTLEYLVFDTGWGGWNKTTVGPNGYDKTGAVTTPKAGDKFTVQVPISVIESKLDPKGTVNGINLQTGGIGASKITILSQKIVGTVEQKGEEFTATGSWTKGSTEGTMVLDSASAGKAVLDVNEWYIGVSQFSVNGFTNPTVDVTVNYSSIPTNTQAEILINDSTPVVPNYVTPRKTGEMTYTTELPQGTTSFLACYDQCEVKSIHVYDNTEKEGEAVTGKTATEINANMNVGWNLGNSFDVVDDNGNVDERAWGNPPVTQKTFQAVKAAGFKSVRIPISYMNMVDSNGDINDAYLDRIQAVVDRAINSGLYVVINIHNDGANKVTGFWLDISKTGSDFDAIKNKFTNMWSEIATRFAAYDQRLVFESMNEVMIANHYTDAPAPAYANINALNQAFVNAVRNAGQKNADRCLIIPGYNTDINLTVANYGKDGGFKVPADTIEDRLILSVHFYDPYDLTLDMNSSTSEVTDAMLANISTQFTKIKNASTLPIFIGEYCILDKGNDLDRGFYLDAVKTEAATRGITLCYWDNGSYVRGGSAIFDRQSNQITESGNALLSAITVK